MRRDPEKERRTFWTREKSWVRLAQMAKGYSKFVLFAMACLGLQWVHEARAQVVEVEREGLGVFSVSDFLLQPGFIFDESKRGRFDVGSSYLAARWKRDVFFSAQIKFGSLDLLGVPARYDRQTDRSWGLVEGYGQFDATYGRFRLGLIPIPYGLEGGDADSRLNFPRSLFYQKKQVGFRDYGLGYRMFNRGFFSEWAIHNGESGPDLDNELWFTVRTGYQGGRFFRVGVSGSTGRTSVLSTNPEGTSSSEAAGLNVDQPSRNRLANFFLSVDARPVRVDLEVNASEMTQETQIFKQRAGHLDLTWSASDLLLCLVRYDVYDPQTDQTSDRLEAYSLGLALRSQHETSVLYLIGTKSLLEDGGPGTHSVRLVWRLTPSATDVRAPL